MGTDPTSGRLGSESALKRALAYRKFASDRATVLLLDGNYHLGAECLRAFDRLGHRVESVPVTTPVASFVQALLWKLVEVRPDFVLSINHLGFDEGGALGALLEELELPVAVWYVDSPQFVLRQGGLPARSVTSLFLWERTLLPAMRARGAEDLHYLPLATDPSRFPCRPEAPARPLAFVGDSMQSAQEKWRARLNGAGRRQARRLAEALLAAASAADRAALLHPADGPGRPDWNVLGAATWEATATHRLGLLRAVAGPDLHLYGDAGWKRLLPTATFCGPLDYGEALAAVYRSSAVNLNATSRQMPTAVNQRVFDVPACGGFVLSDAQADVGEHFELGSEAVVYRDADELAALCRHYLAHPEERAAVARRARERVLRDHTYETRVQTLLAALRARHAPRANAASVAPAT
ncbi:MAG: glycosyltransferase [Deltaproteobacteria bacterium]|nr:glycosyltransferase [Deltaproteobacteria bacterium]